MNLLNNTRLSAEALNSFLYTYITYTFHASLSWAKFDGTHYLNDSTKTNNVLPGIYLWYLFDFKGLGQFDFKNTFYFIVCFLKLDKI